MGASEKLSNELVSVALLLFILFLMTSKVCACMRLLVCVDVGAWVSERLCVSV